LNGVKKGLKKVATAVSVTDRETLAPEMDEKKLEIFPPGQDATKIIPSAKAGWGLKARIKIKVSKGSKRNWEPTPAKTAFGFFFSWLKSAVFIPSATPNMIKPKHKLSSTRLSSENEMEIVLRDIVGSKVFDFYKERRKTKTASAS